MTNYALTTIDNPYNPFEQFKKWFLFDVEKGYRTCERLARVARISEEFSDEENNAEMNRAIDEIIAEDPTNMFKRVTESDFNRQKPAPQSAKLTSTIKKQA